ncbi:MAG: amidohydrolase family protein [bacterium]|nr:amidohydrolase family protein [bacterium]
MHDYCIKNATIIDGTGNAPYEGSLLVKKDTISEIIRGRETRLPRAKKTISGEGKVLSPGFIDIHTHYDFILNEPDHFDAMEQVISQGITTVVTGQCGFSPAPLFQDHISDMHNFAVLLCDGPFKESDSSMNSFFERLETQGVVCNMAHMAGHAALRATIKGLFSAERLTMSDLRRIQYSLDESFDAGVFGLSFGLAYPPGMFAPKAEINWFASIAKRRGGIVTAHLKAYNALSDLYPIIPGGTAHNVIALREVINMARDVDVPLQVSHLLFVFKPTWKTADRCLGMIEKAYKQGVDIAFDGFPYLYGNTGILAIFPHWFIEGFTNNIGKRSMYRKLKMNLTAARYFLKFDSGKFRVLSAWYEPYKKYEGMLFSDIARDLGLDVIDTLIDFTEKSEGKARILTADYYDGLGPDSITGRLMAHPLCHFETDALVTREGLQNPAAAGCFPRILGTYSREYGLMSMADAVHRMTGASARRIGIQKRGELRKGYFADLVLFDPETIRDREDRTEPVTGIDYVFINGSPVVGNKGFEKKKKFGKVLRKTT